MDGRGTTAGTGGTVPNLLPSGGSTESCIACPRNSNQRVELDSVIIRSSDFSFMCGRGGSGARPQDAFIFARLACHIYEAAFSGVRPRITLEIRV